MTRRTGDVRIAWGADTLAAALDALPDYRVLRRLRPEEPSGTSRRRVWSGVVLDVETTGLAVGTDLVIELAMQRIGADGHGRIVEIGTPHRWLEDPGVPIPPEITRLTGITDAAVAGHRINEAVATSLLLDCDGILAHNAAFDRGFVEERLPLAAGRPWICTMRDVDWRGLGFEGRSLSQLVWQTGVFFDEAHRADVDVAALVHLVGHQPRGRGETVLAAAVRNARRVGWVVEARGAPFEAKDMLRARGYRWSAAERCWSREVSDACRDEEAEWCEREVYRRRGSPFVRRVDWTSRYARS